MVAALRQGLVTSRHVLRPGSGRELPRVSLVGLFRGNPSIQPRKGRGLLGAKFSDPFQPMLNRLPRVDAFFWRRIEGRMCLSTLRVSRNPVAALLAFGWWLLALSAFAADL